MLHSFAELKGKLAQRLDDPAREVFDDLWLGEFVNEAYQQVVNEIAELPGVGTAQDDADAVAVTVVTGTREYEVGDYRRVLQVLDNTSAPTNPNALDIVPYHLRNDRTRVNGVYVFRNTADGKWYVGIVAMEPAFNALLVHVVPQLVKLVGGTDVPYEVPEAHHDAVWARAVVLAKIELNRDPAGAAQRSEYEMERLRNGLSGQVNPGRSSRLFGR